MWWYVGILLGVAILAILGYLIMINVKARRPRPEVGGAVRAEIHALETRLMGHVRALSGIIGERNLHRPLALRAAADSIHQVWKSQGFEVSEERFEVLDQSCTNLVVEQRGSKSHRPILLVGAHYDSVIGSPGANDNATGVAILLELSRAMRRQALAKTVRLVAFVNEEPPYFLTEMMGSRHHARQARNRGENIAAMFSLETLGYYSNVTKSQRYPWPFSAFYPRIGNFLGVVGNLSSRGLVVDFLRQFMTVSDFPAEGIATFEWIPGINWSDHWSFWQEGYSALMLTDTAPYRYPEYHTLRDVAEEINGPEFARAAHGIVLAIRRMADAE
jgi:hypothetical protein